MREGRHPLAAGVPGVPAHVVGVQMRVDHDVDVLRPDARPLQPAQEVALPPVEERSAGAFPAVADTGVDQHGPAAGPHHPGLERHHGPVPARLPVVGDELRRMGVPTPRARTPAPARRRARRAPATPRRGAPRRHRSRNAVPRSSLMTPTLGARVERSHPRSAQLNTLSSHGCGQRCDRRGPGGAPSSHRLRVAGAWCVRLAPYEGAGFHVVLSGSCLLVPDGGGAPVALGPGTWCCCRTAPGTCWRTRRRSWPRYGGRCPSRRRGTRTYGTPGRAPRWSCCAASTVSTAAVRTR